MNDKKISCGRKKRNGFLLGLAVYAGVLLLLGAVGLYVFHDYLVHFEASQIKYALMDYQQSLEQTIPEAAEDALSELEPSIRDSEESQSFVQDLLQNAKLVKDHLNSSEESQLYSVVAADGQKLGEVSFAPVGEMRYHLPVWGIKQEQFDFSPYYRTSQVTVPPDYMVFLGNLRLEREFIAEDEIPYQTLEECYRHYADLPTLVRYETPPYLGELSLRVCREDGTELGPEDLTEEVFLDRCSAAIREEAEEYVPEFVHQYVSFSANIHDSAMGYYLSLCRMIVPDSQLQTMLHLAIDGLRYSKTRSVKVLSTEICRMTDLGENRYLADIRYSSEVGGQNGRVQMDEHIQLVLIDDGGTLLADALYLI